MNDVLDGLAIWGSEKQEAIKDYIFQIGEPYAELLVQRLAEETELSLRRGWMELLISLGEKAQRIVVSALEDDRWYLLRNLLLVLEKLPGKLPLNQIKKLAKHEHSKVRQESLRILIRLHLSVADRLLLAELSSPDPELLIPAIQLAEQSRDSAILERLHQMFLGEQHSMAEVEIKMQLIRTLSAIGSSRTLPVFKGFLDKKGLIWSRRNRSLQREVLKNLQNFPKEAAASFLKTLIEEKNHQFSELARERLEHLEDAS